MEQRLSNTWRMTVNEKKFIETALLSDLRIDGRGPFDYRSLTIQFGSEDGSSEVKLGQTRVMGFVTSQLVQPYRDRPNEGTLSIFTEFSPMADPSFEVGRPGEFAVELGRIIDRGLRIANQNNYLVVSHQKCVAGKAGQWTQNHFVSLLNRNLVDAANIAALTALLTFRRPECTLGGENGQEVTIHPPENELSFWIRFVRSIALPYESASLLRQTWEPLPLIIHHLPIAVTFAFIGAESTVVIDPSHFEEAVMGGKLTATLNTNGDVCAIQKAGGEGVIQSVIMQCLRIASVKAGDITTKIKKEVEVYNSARALKKIKRHPDLVGVSQVAQKGVDNLSKAMGKREMKTEDRSTQEDMEIETNSSKNDESSLGNVKLRAFIGGPSSWDPYSKGVNVDELKASLGLRAAVIPEQKMDVLPPENPESDQPLRDEDPPSPPSQDTAKAQQQMTKPKTLKDAVKPKHKRKKKNLLNTDGS
ncbi:exosome complex component Rrp42 [Striga asiatica]|uniref:Exosome complex component Rrp42 n=1 Tax=Striga asiatica TaxID=4170 RepID=A0A5A7Q843_STRAF|nr:exosome complex component Rrp42 [Striga asiatica]